MDDSQSLHRFALIAIAGWLLTAFAGVTGDYAPATDGFRVNTTFSSSLPVLVLEFSPKATLSVYDPGATIAGSPSLSLELEQRPLGEPGPLSEKVGYSLIPSATDARIRLPVAMLGLPPATGWILRGSARDKGMLRTGLAYALGKLLFPAATPHHRFCEVLVRDGASLRYNGIYILECADNSDATPGAALSYPSDGERRGDGVVRVGNTIFTVDRFIDTATRQAMEADLTRLDDALRSVRPTDYLRFETMLDMASVIDWYLLNALTLNALESTIPLRLFKNARGTIEFLPQWQFGGSLDNEPVRNRPLPFEMEVVEVEPPSVLSRRLPVWRVLEGGGDIRDIRLYPVYAALGGSRFLWFDRLFLSRRFVTGLYRRYHALRRAGLSQQGVRTMVNTMAAELGPALGRDWRRWREQYTAVDGSYGLRPFVDGEGEVHRRQTWSPDQELVKIYHCLGSQNAFLAGQLEQLEWMTDDLYDKGTSGTRQAGYAFLAIIGMMVLMHLLTRRL